MSEKPNDILKLEIAEELGLLDKVNASGWKSLSAKESGRIGGILARRKKATASAEGE
ncbi:MAG: alpha/beta-type small acid-soluble spore protein [Defluviitaleaceae bacterium]|nr:alpha/beta-type small acid-soluble spore protein [Defluviitaleaceae bacterium]MCL2263567.1 alpha/beta-type small acid-soluble spore protein [Defluviitaleaceae bacterium]